MRARSTLRVARKRVGIPMSSAYQRDELLAADATELETRPASPSDPAAPLGDLEAASAAIPSPATRTRPKGSIQMNRR
jgi:hypothetical protein